MKRITSEFNFTVEQQNQINELAKAFSLTEAVAGIIYGRGADSADKMQKFLNPGAEHFISPLKMRGMAEAVELITRARDEEWDVLVYGDYDADGVCAATIMSGALADFGINAQVFVPERTNGYGVTIGALDNIFEEFFPQLVITVDCGISNAKEVEYLKESGCEVIVTDHHELPQELPDCICINPKFEDGYPYDNLCGAGVAFKVACALNGKSAYKYLDFAALATVADSVPLTGENRDIVAEGLKIINKSPRKCMGYFLSKSQEGASAQTLAFSLAPKINAAGRMGDAASALELFTSKDDKRISALCEKLTAYNQERQARCDELYAQAKLKLSASGAYGRVIMLADDGWNSGFVGIVAARLTEEYGRPVILFVKNGSMLKGSARSVEGINIFEALKACKQYISEFGGHSQAAGVNVEEASFSSLERALNEYMEANYSAEDFIPSLCITGLAEAGNFVRVAKELELLEPCGVGNKRPLFCMEAQNLAVKPIKPQSPHLSFKYGAMEFMYFSGAKNAEILQCGAPKNIIFEYNVSRFKGKEYVRAFVRDIVYGSDSGAYSSEYLSFNAVMLAASKEGEYTSRRATACEIDELMGAEDGQFGTVYLANDYSTLARYKNSAKLGVDMFSLSSRSLLSVIVVAPSPDCDVSGFKRVVWLDEPKGAYLNPSPSAEVIICEDISGAKPLADINSSRAAMAEVFSYVSANSGLLEGSCAEEVALYNAAPFSKAQFLFALKVFEELSLIDFSSGRIIVYRGAKTELSRSALYRKLSAL